MLYIHIRLLLFLLFFLLISCYIFLVHRDDVQLRCIEYESNDNHMFILNRLLFLLSLCLMYGFLSITGMENRISKAIFDTDR